MHNLPPGFDIYLVNVKTMRKIAQIFVAFSEKLNFTSELGLISIWIRYHLKHLKRMLALMSTHHVTQK